MARIYFEQPRDVKPLTGAQRVTTYHVTINGERHTVPATHRGMLAFLRSAMPGPRRQEVQA